VKEDPIAEITETGIKMQDGKEYDLAAIVSPRASMLVPMP
jgi:hypothetical protein